MGLGIFQEMNREDEEFTLQLWRRVRTIIDQQAGRDDGDHTVQAPEPTLDEAFACIRNAAGHRREFVACSLVAISTWAEDNSYLQTATLCVESAAYLTPGDPAPAIIAGRLRRRTADYDRAEGWYLRGAALARSLQKWELFIQALLWHGFLHFQKAEYSEAERKYRSAGRAARRYGRRALAGVAHHNLLTLASDLGSYAEGERHALRALSLYPVYFPRVPHLVHDYAFLLARNGFYTAALKLLDHVEPLISAVQERVVVVGNIARAAGGARRADRFETAADEVVRLASVSDENASRGLLGAAEGAHSLGQASRAVDLAARAMDLALRRSDNEVQRLARVLIERTERQESPPADRAAPSGYAALARECVDRLGRWASRPRGQAARMLRKHEPKQPPPSETAASTGWRRGAT